MLLVVVDFMGVSESSACIITEVVTNAIASLRPTFVKMPSTPDEILEVQLNFYKIAKFPKVIGAIDCTVIEIESPGDPRPEYYRCRKGYFAWNVQTVCDARLKILDIVARWPGSTHDQTVFNHSALKRKFLLGSFGDSMIVGDSGYAITSYLMTPLSNPILPEEVLYNESQIRTRNCIERSYGVWKRRFPILSLCMRVALQKSQNIIIATAVLHNLAIDQGNEVPCEDPEIISAIRANEARRRARERDNNELQMGGANRTAGRGERRRNLINGYFKNLIQ